MCGGAECPSSRQASVCHPAVLRSKDWLPASRNKGRHVERRTPDECAARRRHRAAQRSYRPSRSRRDWAWVEGGDRRLPRRSEPAAGPLRLWPRMHSARRASPGRTGFRRGNWVEAGLGRRLDQLRPRPLPTGAIEDAKTTMRQALRHATDHAAARANFGAFLHITGEPEAAEGLLRQTLEREPFNAGARLNLVADLLQEERGSTRIARNSMTPAAGCAR
jgi:hypothetical protein